MTAGQQLDSVSVVPCTRAGIPSGVHEIRYRTDREDWALLEPPATGTRWAVVLHGHGSAGDQIYRRKDLNAMWRPALRRHGLGLLSPNLRGNAWMSPEARHDLRLLLEWLRQTHSATDFIFFSGSMGATGSLLYACFHPGDVAGLALGCPATDLGSYLQWCGQDGRPEVVAGIAEAIREAYGHGPEAISSASALLRTGALAGIPCSIVHGDHDDIIPVGQSRRLAAKMSPSEDFIYREIPGGDHEAPIGHTGGLDWVLTRVLNKTLRVAHPAPRGSISSPGPG